MAQTRATLAQLESRLASGGDASGIRATLRDERRKLLVLDEAYRAEFARIDSTLRRAGLTPNELEEKLDVWRDFTAHYRQRMDASLAAFDRLSGASVPSRREIASLRAGLGEPAVFSTKPFPVPPSAVALRDFPSRAEPISHADAPEPPGPADLAETSVVKLSADIRALASALGNSPAALFAYVHDNIRWVPYFLAMQNSEAVLWAGRGSDADQATLLIALLRAAGIPARYVIGDISISTEDAINWTGTKDRSGALRTLLAATLGQVIGTEGVQIQHTWVEAWVDNGAGPAWVAMSPGFKKQTFQSGLQMSIPVFDRPQFLSVPSTRLSTEVYSDQIHGALATAFPGRDFTELGYTGTVVPAPTDKLPQFPFTPVDVTTRAAALPADAEWKATVALADRVSNQIYLTRDFLLPEVCLQSLTISYVAATEADQKVINSFGGIDKVPAGMVNLLAQFRLDDAIVATSTPVSNLKALKLTDAVRSPNPSTPLKTATYAEFAGEPAAVALVGPQVSDKWIGARIDSLLAMLPSASLDSVVRETLFLAGMLHDQQMQHEWASISGPLQYNFDYSLQVPFGTNLLASSAITALFDRPFLATARFFAMDDGIIPPRPFNINAPLGTPADVNVFQAMDAARSSSECVTFERLALLASVCTINAMQTASQNKIPILTINQSNSGTLLPTVASLPDDIASSIRSYVQGGATVTIPQRPVTMGAWTGFPWIVDWADITQPSFFGVNQLNGAYTSGDAEPAPVTDNPGVTGEPTAANGTSCSDPVTVSNGNMFQQQTDLAISSRGPSLVLSRTYNSFSAPNDGPFGYGWSHSYATSLKDSGSTVTLTNGTGGSSNFTLQGGNYVSPPGLNLKLTKDAQGYTILEKHGTQFRFNTKGVLQSITDRNGNALMLSYDQSGRLTTITDALNRAVTLSYGSGNHVASVQDFAGRKVIYSYDSSGNLASVMDAGGNRTSYSYYSGVFAHLLQTVTKPAGNSTSFEYYVNRQTARISDSAGRNMRLLYLPFSHQTIFIDARGFATSYFFNALGNVTRVVKPDGNYVDTTFTADAKVASTEDENGNVTQFAYDALGNLTSVMDALAGTLKLAYEPNFNMVTSLTDALGKVTKFEYDSHGNLVHEVRPLGVETRFAYDSFGEVISGTDGEGNTAHIAYDAFGNPTTVTDPLGNASQFKYDQLRRLIGITDPLGNAGSLQFDELDHLTQVTDPLGATISSVYDGNGNTTQITDANGRATRFSYDPLDNLAQVTDARSGITQYGYSEPGCGCQSAGSDLLADRSASAETRSYVYDFNHSLTQVTDAMGGTTSFGYNARGDLVQKRDAKGNVIRYEYDAAGRLLHKIFPDGSDARFTYDVGGHLTGLSNANSSLTFTYDDLSRLTSATDSRFGKTIKFAYNRNSQRIALTDSEGGVISYSYDAGGNLVSVTNPSGAKVHFGYDALNRAVTRAYSNGVIASASFDAAGRTESISYQGGQTGQSSIRHQRRRAVAGFAHFFVFI